MNQSQHFKEYQDLIRQQAWKFANWWRLGHLYEDIEAQGYEIYTQALELYNADKGASFLTFLYWRLQKLEDFCEYENRRGTSHTFLEPEIMDTYFQSMTYDDFSKRLDYLDDVAKSLSEDATAILEYIRDGEWRQPGVNRRPSHTSVEVKFRTLGWTIPRIAEAWSEIKEWWGIRDYATA